MLAIESAYPNEPVSLPASLYSCCGKLAVQITCLGNDRATVLAGARPVSGSLAFLVRNGIKLPAKIVWGHGGRLGLSFEDALLDGRRDDKFRAEA